MPAFSSLLASVNNEVGIAAPFCTHVQDGSADQPPVFTARDKARPSVVDEEAIAQRPPHIASILRVLALFAVQLSVYDSRLPVDFSAEGRGTVRVVAAGSVDVGDGQEHVVKVLAGVVHGGRGLSKCGHDDRPRHNVLDIELALLVVAIHPPHERDVTAPTHGLAEDGHIFFPRPRKRLGGIPVEWRGRKEGIGC